MRPYQQALQALFVTAGTNVRGVGRFRTAFASGVFEVTNPREDIMADELSKHGKRTDDTDVELHKFHHRPKR